MKNDPKFKFLILILLLSLAAGCFMSCDNTSDNESTCSNSDTEELCESESKDSSSETFENTESSSEKEPESTESAGGESSETDEETALVPSLDELFNCTEDEIYRKLTELSSEDLKSAWGDPVGILSGFRADIWYMDYECTTKITVYYNNDESIMKVVKEKRDTGSFTEGSIDDEELAKLINAKSTPAVQLLMKSTEEGILKNPNVEAGFGCYLLRFEEEIMIKRDGAYVTEVYDWEYTFTAYPDESDGGWFVTRIWTNNPYAGICHVCAYNSDLDSLRQHYESICFDVTVEGKALTAKRGGITITYVTNDTGDVETGISMTVTNKEGIDY